MGSSRPHIKNKRNTLILHNNKNYLFTRNRKSLLSYAFRIHTSNHTIMRYKNLTRNVQIHILLSLYTYLYINFYSSIHIMKMHCFKAIKMFVLIIKLKIKNLPWHSNMHYYCTYNNNIVIILPAVAHILNYNKNNNKPAKICHIR